MFPADSSLPKNFIVANESNFIVANESNWAYFRASSIFNIFYLALAFVYFRKWNPANDFNILGVEKLKY